MAANTQEKRRTLARNAVTQVTLAMNAHRILLDLLEEVSLSGLTFTDADFDGVQGLQHLDATTFNAIGPALQAVDTTLRTNSQAHLRAYLKLIA